MSFNLPKFEIPNEMRDFAEKSVEQAKKAFDGFMGAAHKAVDTVNEKTNIASMPGADFTRKAMAQAESNVSAAFEHAQRLVRAKDAQEVMKLQTEFLQAQLAQVQAQMKEMGGNVQKMFEQATQMGKK
jgi:phasin